MIGPPLAGDNWVALNGCCEPGFPHRSSPAPANGKIVNGQRFAIDWKRMNDAGEFFEGDPNHNESYVDYGADLLAVADGTVVATFDGMEANPPGVLPANDPQLRDQLTIETVDGNHIVLDLDDGVHAFYAHIVEGTLLVEEGDSVKGATRSPIWATPATQTPRTCTSISWIHRRCWVATVCPMSSTASTTTVRPIPSSCSTPTTSSLATSARVSGDFGQSRLPRPEERIDELPMNLAIVNFADRE